MLNLVLILGHPQISATALLEKDIVVVLERGIWI